MLRNNRGVTILALIITVLILIILTSVSLNTGFSTVEDIRIGRIMSSMTMVKAKMETIYEQYQFNGTQLVGTPSDIEIELSAQEQELLGNTVNSWKWYKWDANTLQSQGLDGKMLGKNKYFLVNYEHFEILYSQKTSGENGEYYHSMTGLEKLLEN